jgi:putative aldouronate transport system permease protein
MSDVMKRSFRRSLIMYRGLLVLLVPSIVWYLVFQYFPMYGVLVAFKNYRLLQGVLGSPWVGLENFQRLFRTPAFLQVLRNTLVISFLKLLWGFPAPILLALLLNEVKGMRFKRVVQTVSYLPHFISWVVIGGFVRALLSPTGGAVNQLLGLFHVGPIRFLIEPSFFRSIIVVSDIWKNVGWGSIIYLASITGIDPQLYEAAVMDGAGRFRQAVSITLPSLASVMVILFLLRIGNVMSAGFEEIFNLYNPVVYSVADIIDTYVYRVGLIDFDYSYSTAIGLFKNVLGLFLLVVTNTVTRRFSEYGVW